jgi:UDP-2,3-diacylglucosamine pyrophosphatase LpxH
VIMTVVGDGFSIGQGLRALPRPIQGAWRSIAFQRLNHALETAVPVPFDDDSRIIFLSDCHRGDNSPADAFAQNKSIFRAALAHYFDSGFTYIEVGDGDELWQNGRFSDILSAHADVFDLLHRFDAENRLYLLIGNHDTYNAFRHQEDKDGLRTYQSLLLTHRTGGHSVLVVHGHQADMTSSRYYTLTRILSRSLWRRLKTRAFVRKLMREIAQSTTDAEPQMPSSRFAGQGKRIEQQIIEWVTTRHIPVVCGHTHLPALPGAAMPPYFNSGSCVRHGYITGLELQNGEMTLVKWTLDSHGRPERHRLAHPRKIAAARQGQTG